MSSNTGNNQCEVTWDEIAAEITRISSDRIRTINAFYIMMNTPNRVRDLRIMEIILMILERLGWAVIVLISSLLALGFMAFFAGFGGALASNPIIALPLGVTAGYWGFQIYKERAIFQATTRILKLAKEKFDLLPSRVRYNNGELETLIKESAKNIIIDAFHLTQEEYEDSQSHR